VSASTTIQFENVLIIGVGLIGGSLGLALKKNQLTKKVMGVGRSQSNLDDAIRIGAIDEAVSLEIGVPQADLIVICVPVAQTEKILREIHPHLKSTTLITDVGSTKLDVVEAAKNALGDDVVQFVPAHPIAGSAQHGALASKVDLFENRQVIICPLQENGAARIEQMSRLWKSVGANLFTMSAIQHDAVFAAVSHLPHVLSYALMLQVANAEDAPTKFRHAGAGFRDFTRIAASSPEMWRDICMANRDAILKELDSYMAVVSHMQALLKNKDSQSLEKLFAKASESRNKWELN
jgi:prephenate dehydrogenase